MVSTSSGGLLLLVPTLIGMSLLIFIMLRLLPGDVVDVMMAGDTPPAIRSRRLREAFGLDKPLPIQYLDWVGGMVAQGDLGSRCAPASPSRRS